MFTDEALDCVSVASVWRKSQQSEGETRACQTRAVHSAEAEVQTGTTTVACTQTEPLDRTTERILQQNPGDPEPPGLKDFLLRAEEAVSGELVRNSRSHAFDGFQVNWDQRSEQISRLHLLKHPVAQDKSLHVTSVSWSCTGSVVACGYGRIDDGDWRTESSYVCTWNLDRRGLDAKQADVVIDVPTAVTALCCHPCQPALIAGGLYSGEVLVWDFSRSQDLVLAQTGMSVNSHREPVYQVAWVPLQKKGEFGLVSACSGGRVLLWTLDSEQSSLVLSAAYALVPQQVPHGSDVRFKARGSSSSVGVTSLSLSPWDGDTFLVGSEGGLLLRCSFCAQTPAAVAPDDHGLTLRAPAVFSFRPCSGPVHSVHCSPFHRNLFVSAGTDGLVHVHSLLQVNPLVSLRVSDSYVFQVQWSPSRPLVLAAATGQVPVSVSVFTDLCPSSMSNYCRPLSLPVSLSVRLVSPSRFHVSFPPSLLSLSLSLSLSGEVQIFDLGRRSQRAAASVSHDTVGGAATCLDFNGQNPRLLAVGHTDGTVAVWQLSADLTEQKPRESGQLEQIANQVAE